MSDYSSDDDGIDYDLKKNQESDEEESDEEESESDGEMNDGAKKGKAKKAKTMKPKRLLNCRHLVFIAGSPTESAKRSTQ